MEVESTPDITVPIYYYQSDAEHRAREVTCTWYCATFVVINYSLIRPFNFNELVMFMRCLLTPFYIWHLLRYIYIYNTFF